MINTNVKIIVLIVILISVLSLVYFLIFSPKEQEVEEIEKSAVEIELELQKQASEIVKTKDFDKCDEIEDETYRTVCVNNIALNLAKETQDIFYCRKLDDKLIGIKTCELNIATKKAYDEEDVKYCDDIQDLEFRGFCIMRTWATFALKKGDRELCDNIKLIENKEACYDNIIFKTEFVDEEVDFDCNKFYNERLKEDCKLYEGISLNKEKFITCRQFKSNLFLEHCVATKGVY